MSIPDLKIKKLGVEFILKVECKELDPNAWDDMILLSGKKSKKVVDAFKQAGFCDKKGTLLPQETPICKMEVRAIQGTDKKHLIDYYGWPNDFVNKFVSWNLVKVLDGKMFNKLHTDMNKKFVQEVEAPQPGIVHVNKPEFSSSIKMSQSGS